MKRPNPTKGTRPPLTTDREGFREGRGCDFGGVRTREDLPDQRNQTPLPTDREGFRVRGEGLGWTGEKNQIVVGMNP